MMQMNLSMKQNKTHKHRDSLVVAKREGARGGRDWELRIGGCKLLCIGWVNNKVLLEPASPAAPALQWILHC